MKKVQYFQLDETKILEEQIKHCKKLGVGNPHLINILERPYPPSTYDVAFPNFLFAERIKLPAELGEEDKSDQHSKQQQEFESVGQGSSSKTEEIRATTKFDQKNFVFNQVLAAETIFFQQEFKTAKTIDVVFQARGFGKTQYLMSHAVTDKKPTIYIDLAKLKESILSDTIDRIDMEISNGDSNRTSKTKLARVFFFLFFSIQIETIELFTPFFDRNISNDSSCAR